MSVCRAHAHQQAHGVPADRRAHEPAAPRGTHAAGRAALRAVAGRVALGPAAEPFRSCRCQTGTSPSLSRPSNTRAPNALDSSLSRAVFFIFSTTH